MTTLAIDGTKNFATNTTRSASGISNYFGEFVFPMQSSKPHSSERNVGKRTYGSWQQVGTNGKYLTTVSNEELNNFRRNKVDLFLDNLANTCRVDTVTELKSFLTVNYRTFLALKKMLSDVSENENLVTQEVSVDFVVGDEDVVSFVNVEFYTGRDEEEALKIDDIFRSKNPHLSHIKALQFYFI